MLVFSFEFPLIWDSFICARVSSRINWTLCAMFFKSELIGVLVSGLFVSRSSLSENFCIVIDFSSGVFGTSFLVLVLMPACLGPFVLCLF